MALFDDTRADWNAGPPRHPVTIVSPSSRVGRMWHYNGPAMHLAGRSHSSCLTAVKADQRFHQGPARGWNDIGYNALICPHGRAIEGRGIDAVGAHCAGYNTSWYGLQFMLGEGETPTAAQLARAERLAADVQSRSGRSLRDLPHSAGFATECPGPVITRWIKGTKFGSDGGSTISPVAGGGAANQQEVIDMQMDDTVPTTATEKRVWGLDKVTVGHALKSAEYARVFAYDAKKDAASALEVVKDLAKAGRPLTSDEVEAAAARGAAKALEDKIADSTAYLNVNQGK